jgi:hypothetical protein
VCADARVKKAVLDSVAEEGKKAKARHRFV